MNGSRPTPLNGTKTHPLTPHALQVLRMLRTAPAPKLEINPGVLNRLMREALIEMVSLPSPYRTKTGNYPHAKITGAGLRRIEQEDKP